MPQLFQEGVGHLLSLHKQHKGAVRLLLQQGEKVLRIPLGKQQIGVNAQTFALLQQGRVELRLCMEFLLVDKQVQRPGDVEPPLHLGLPG